MRHERDNRYNDDEYYHNERRRNRQQNASNRWGEPDPRMGPHNFEHEPRHPNHFNHDEYYHNDWQAFEEPQNRHFQEEGRYRNYNQPPEWQQRDQNFGPQNQHADDRWNNQRYRQQQPHHPRHASERFYEEHRRRNH